MRLTRATVLLQDPCGAQEARRRVSADLHGASGSPVHISAGQVRNRQWSSRFTKKKETRGLKLREQAVRLACHGRPACVIARQM